ncbi:hypothetical protein ACIGW3_11540 [Streptomyces sp. NPDC053499]|uniref:hypothetical protein n=1 Tax=Streptomyces sp. NPDC053499 TaxID=3365707 RepID=UPI0037D377BD
MRSQGSTTRSRRGIRIAASAALVCLGAPLAAGCGGGGDDGYVAVGAADPSGRSGDGTGPVKPDDKVRMVPLPGDGDANSNGSGNRNRNGGRDGGKADDANHGGDGDDDGDASKGADGSAAAGATGGPAGASGSAPSGGSGSSGGSNGSTGPSGSQGHSSTNGASGASGASPGSGTPGGGQQSGGSSGPDAPSPPSGPAVLRASEPRRAEADDRWCEKVTVRFTNSGGRTVTGGKVTFRTHIIGALGIDWATRESTRALPVPIRAGEKKEKTWTVCVDAWRVPLGMHIETREVRLSGWK